MISTIRLIRNNLTKYRSNCNTSSVKSLSSTSSGITIASCALWSDTVASPIQARRVNSPDHENIPGFLVGWSGFWGPEIGDDELLHDIHPQLLWLSDSTRLSPIPVERGRLTVTAVQMMITLFQLFRSEWMSRTVLVPQPGLFLPWPGVWAGAGGCCREEEFLTWIITDLSTEQDWSSQTSNISSYSLDSLSFIFY